MQIMLFLIRKTMGKGEESRVPYMWCSYARIRLPFSGLFWFFVFFIFDYLCFFMGLHWGIIKKQKTTPR